MKSTVSKKKPQPKILAWHFTDGMKLRDGQPLKVGKLYKHTGPLVMCASGYHASIDIRDALSYAPGLTVSRVKCSGDMEQGDDKLVCRERKALWSFDAEKVILKWSIRVATDAVKIAKKFCKDKAWNAWADLWISGKDRTYASAISAAYAAGISANYAAAQIASAASAAYNAAYAASKTAAYAASNAASNAAAHAAGISSAYAVAQLDAYVAAQIATYAYAAALAAAHAAGISAAHAAAKTAKTAGRKYSGWLVAMIRKARKA